MNSLPLLLKRAGRALQSNSPAILTAIGVTGTISTAYLVGQATYKMARDEDADPHRTPRQAVETYWRLYIPAGVSCAITIGCIVTANRASTRQAAAIATAYSISEKAFSEYKEKVVEKFGENKEQAVRDEIAQDRVNGADSSKVLVIGAGSVLCCELHTMRFFECSVEKLNKAINEINAKMIRDDQASLSDFYYLIDIPYTTHSSDLGWTSHRLVELEFSTVLGPSDQPCVSFEYNYIRPLD